jgi:hypothetical protein
MGKVCNYIKKNLLILVKIGIALNIDVFLVFYVYSILLFVVNAHDRETVSIMLTKSLVSYKIVQRTI